MSDGGLNNMYAEILMNILLVAFTAALGALAAFLNKRQRWQDKEIKQKDLDLMHDVADVATQAIQQMAKRRNWDNHDKLEQATSYANKLGGRLGVNLSEDEWRAFIEKTINEAKNFEKTLGTPDVLIEGGNPTNVVTDAPAAAPKATRGRPRKVTVPVVSADA